jgi:ABC-type transporter Mla maintaining outer membrane lipid asymmetry ATPase subunit MlaF
MMNLQGAPQRLLLPCRDVDAKNQALDTVCARLHQLKQGFGLLALRGALLSNINVAENLWLSVNWHRQHTADSILLGLQQRFVSLGYDEHASERLLKARPAHLSATDLRAVLLVRALLMEPKILLADNDWFAGVLFADRDLMQRAEPLITHCHWWVFSDDIGAPTHEVDWTSCELSVFLNELNNES